MKRKLIELGRTNCILGGIAAFLCAALTGFICYVNVYFYSVGDYIQGAVLAVILVILGIALFRAARIAKLFEQNKKMRYDRTDNERLFTNFRNGYRDFYEADAVGENPAVQNYTTQIYKNILDLQRMRLNQKGIKMEFASERSEYGNPNVHSRVFFDGKYLINESTEFIDMKKKFFMDGKQVYSRNQSRAAHYTIIQAKQVGQREIICPACGIETTREQLLDGCDYCKTKFTIEDLGTKVSGFSIRDDYRLQKDKFDRARKKLNKGVFWGASIVFFMLCVFVLAVLMIDEGSDMNPIFTLFSVIAISASFGGLIGLLITIFYGIFILPGIHIGASITFYTKKQLEKLRYEDQNDIDSEMRVRANDPLFSLAGFYSNISNKLATVIFAHSKNQVNAFAAVDLSPLLTYYGDIIDVEINRITLENYTIGKALQKAQVTAEVELLGIMGKGLGVVKEKIRLNLIKDANCKTQAVCAPKLSRCPSCGSAITMVEGLNCKYCGHKENLQKYDWVIENWSIA